ncbi:MAG: hypothetical protein L6R38_006440 [Xanthoria sp. 2 TBL-2021]|nr:MAG: hypothetical protein L6R38_006440 [Xanthoria sp. 2 TBL-2021]
MAHRRHGGGRGGFDDGRAVIIEDQYGKILDLSVPRRAGEPRPGPFHQIFFEAMGGPFRCANPDLGCHDGGGCEAQMREILLTEAAKDGYQGPPDPRQVRRIAMPHYDELVEGMLNWALPSRVILPGGGEPVGGPGFTRTIGVEADGGRGGGRRRAHGDPSERGHRRGRGGDGPSGGRHGGGHQHSTGHGI